MQNETLRVLSKLRSTHWDFTDKPVARADIETILRHSICAANNNDRAAISVVVVEDAEVLNAISDGDSGGRAVPTLIYLLDYTRLMAAAKEMGHTAYRPPNRLYEFLYGLHDTSAAAQTAVIAAKSMGIESLVTNFIQRGDVERVKDLLNLPQRYCFPVIQVALGYSDAPDKPSRGLCFSTDNFVHWGRYRPDVDVASINAEMDAAYPEHIDEKYAQAQEWFFSEWRKPWYDEELYLRLAHALNRSELLREPGLCEEG